MLAQGSLIVEDVTAELLSIGKDRIQRFATVLPLHDGFGAVDMSFEVLREDDAEAWNEPVSYNFPSTPS